MKSVLILSWKAIGNVAPAVKELRARDLRPVLVSNLPDDPNAVLCDEHVVFDWDGEQLPTLLQRIDERGLDLVGAVNMVEKLIGWHHAVAAHYGLPGGDAGRTVIASKIKVRDRMRDLGLSAIKYADAASAAPTATTTTSGAQTEARSNAEPAATTTTSTSTSTSTTVDFFPAIVKPARVSGASYLVRRVDDQAELTAYLKHLKDTGSADIEMIVEEYLPGIEFSVDGPVLAGRFHPVLAVEKPDHDDVTHHDAGLEFHPPQTDYVREGVRALCETVSTLCTDLGLDQIWLHFEGRSSPDGRTELIEINPRPGGGQIPKAIREISGIDAIEAVVSMALGVYPPEHLQPLREQPLIGWMDVEAREVGTVDVTSSEADLLALPGVINIKLLNGFQIKSLDIENFFFSFAVTADSVDQLRTHAATVLDTLDYHVVPVSVPAGV